jgi:hypothetical protein
MTKPANAKVLDPGEEFEQDNPLPSLPPVEQETPAQARDLVQQAQGELQLPEPLDPAIQKMSLRGTAANVLGIAVNDLYGFLRGVWKTSKGQEELTNRELSIGIAVVARYGLDPVTREVYMTRGKDGRPIMMIGIDGWIKILDATQHYDGFEMELGFDKDGEVEWAECRIHSTRRKFPAIYRGYASEYRRVGGFVSKQMFSHMLRVFTLRHAARLFVPVSGAMLEEEAAILGAYVEGKGPEDFRREALMDDPNKEPTVTMEDLTGDSTKDDGGETSRDQEASG